ncbi:MAG: DUF3078 domain-containing protein [Bacteroidia bacterium]|nr:DUF3078 domain-containing protein [Bacteroidia bacterium]MCZ2277812.1 DUF3078 domain-containing protein [Bacteroidia bacterium]
MKKTIFALLILSVTCTYAQNDTIWRTGGLSSLNFNQVSLSNWAAGGDNSIGGNVLLSIYADYKNGKWAWDNNLDLMIGGAKIGKQEFRKTDDKIELNAKVGYEVTKSLYVTYLLGFRTQFTEGFNYIDDKTRNRISNFLTPAYLVNSLGIDWKPNSHLSVFISPLTAKTTIVNDKLLLDQAELADVPLFGVDPGKKMRSEVGAFFTSKYQKELFENVTFTTKLELFSSYTHKPQDVDVNWENLISLKINKYLTAIITTQLLYDNDVFVPKSDVNKPAGPGTQFKETFGLGLSYKFDSVKVRQ